MLRSYYASPSSGEAYRDRRLTTNFELWVEIFCVPTCIHVRIPKTCLCPSVSPSVCPYPEKRNHPVSVKISPTLKIDASMERSLRVLQHWSPKKLNFFLKNFEIDEIEIFCSYPEKRNRPGVVDISPTLVIDTSMERCSRILQHSNPKSWIFFKKVRNWLNWILSVPQVSVPREKKSPWFHLYQSYISNWYINGKVFEYYSIETQKVDLKKKSSKLNFDSYFDLCRRAEITLTSISVLH